MSLSLALQSALSGISLNQQIISTVSSNVANANTLGYTRKTLGQASRVLGNQGAGVNALQVQRSVSDTLIRDLRKEATLMGNLAARNNIFSRTQEFFGTPGENRGVNAKVNLLSDAFAALGVTPQDSVAQLGMINNAEELSRNIRRMVQDAQTLRSDADREINDAVDRINELLGQIKTSNDDIAAGLARNQSIAEFEDRRDTQVAELSGLVNINSYTDDLGRLNINIQGVTVLDSDVRPLSYDPQINVSTNSTFNPIMVGTIDITSNINGGALKGYLDVRDVDLPNMTAEIDALARMLHEEVNAAHNLGTAFPPPQTLTGATLGFAAGDAFNATGSIRIAITDASGDLVNNMDFDLATLAPATVGQLVTEINAALGPGTASLGAGGELILDGGAGNGIGIAEITPVAIAGSTRGFSHFFGMNNFFSANEAAVNPGEFAQSFNVESYLTTDPNRFARGTLSTAVPVVAGDNMLAIGDGNNAEAMSAVFTQNFTFPAAGDLSSITRTLTDYAGSIINNASNKSALAESDAQIQAGIVEGIQFKMGAISGVNLDQELGELIIYEQAYNGSAQIVRTVTEMFEEIQNLVT